VSEIETLIRSIVREEIAKLNPTSTMTPADHRLKARLSIEQLSKALKIPMCVEQLYRYERGELSCIDDRRVVLRMRAISEILNIDIVTYRQAVRSQMQQR